MDKNFKIESKSILAVEGKDECNFFKALLNHLQISRVQCVDIGGKDRFFFEFQAFSILEGFTSIEQMGFVRDAEINPAQSAFSSICGLLKKYNLPIPAKQNEIKIVDGKRIGNFIMPDNVNTGMLETLCLKSIENEPVNDCIDSYVRCFQGHQKTEEKSRYNDPKARVQTYLAARSPIANSLGLGALNGYWNFGHACFTGIKEFLKQLFT